MKNFLAALFGLLAALAVPAVAAASFPVIPGSASFALPTVDLSGETARQVVVAQGTDKIYQGHPTTALLADGKTIYCVWTLGHGGKLGPMKRSDNGGRTWSELLPTPASWAATANCPAIYRLKDPAGKERLVVFAGHGPDPQASMHAAWSENDGQTWTEMKNLGLADPVMPFCSIEPIDGGKRLLGVTNLRRPGEKQEARSNVLAQSLSSDGGLTWSPWRIILDLPGLKPCEPWLVRSPGGKQLLCLIRENEQRVALFMTSADEGQAWSATKPLSPALFGDRHVARYLPDGRLVICFRDTGKESPTRDHFVAWVGSYADLLAGRAGDYRVKLLHSYRGSDCGYPGVEILPTGEVVATTYLKYREGPEKNSVVSTRFLPAEVEASLKIPALQRAN